MQLFPQKECIIELNNNSEQAISKLKDQTLSKEQFVADWDKQAFIGKIENHVFEIKLSKKLYGNFCVLKGKLENQKAFVQIHTSKVIKIGFVVMIVISISAMLTAIIHNRWEDILKYILAVLVLKFIFIELGFRIVSQKGIKRLTEIIGINK
ncbi:hypothetical protein FIA58_003690 [Flavobacterium jejuense]|uniref:Uncharacterized protein n=1 Tax=Flavobacterium jejuense TaxID=1544455 RepID=A0ABX0ILU7_9FLAO|nr:hypothetical protein [Flavobacterium jejuense]NHN24770.1 hypothetical protein [Flavobacterium jejuense]